MYFPAQKCDFCTLERNQSGDKNKASLTNRNGARRRKHYKLIINKMETQQRFYIKSNFGHWSVIDRTTNKMIVGYSTKKHAEQTMESLNKIQDANEVLKTIESLKTLQGYGQFTK
jgi:hypothetical protein